MRRRYRTEYFTVFSGADMNVDRFSVYPSGKFFQGFYIFRFMKRIGGAFLRRFVDPAGSRLFGKSLFEQKIFCVSVRNFDDVAFLSASFYVLFQYDFHGNLLFLILYERACFVNRIGIFFIKFAQNTGKEEWKWRNKLIAAFPAGLPIVNSIKTECTAN